MLKEIIILVIQRKNTKYWDCISAEEKVIRMVSLTDWLCHRLNMLIWLESLEQVPDRTNSQDTLQKLGRQMFANGPILADAEPLSSWCDRAIRQRCAVS